MGVDNNDSNKFKIGTSTIGQSTRLTIDSSGKVGIGNSSPAHTLDVSGDINLTGSIDLPDVVEGTNLNNSVGISTLNDVSIGGTTGFRSSWRQNY